MAEYKFKHKDMEFSKDGQLDELIALDRYAIPTFDKYEVGDTVVSIIDKAMGTKKVGTVTKLLPNKGLEIRDRLGELYKTTEELSQKPLETKPAQLWERWAKAAASEEKEHLQGKWENDFRWLFDGYRYSLGGRIQLMLGQEYVTGKKASLTAFNCFVARSPQTLDDPEEQFIDVLDVAYKEASIMKRGGGVGLNISTINTIKGTSNKAEDFIFYLDKSHKDYEELQDRIKLGKFKGVTIVDNIEEFSKLSKDAEVIEVTDSVDNGLFDEMKQMVSIAYSGKKVAMNYNNLRYRDSLVTSVNGRSSGSVSWMELFVLVANIAQQKEIDNVDFAEIFSHIVHLIIQGGSRRGALMLINTTENENIHKFMERKKTPGYLSGANISVGISDTFMDTVLSGKENIKNKTILSDDEIKALELWKVLYSSAWHSAEPGIVWMERMNKESNSYYYIDLIATNPCGEQPLPAWGVCNLGHFVLPTYFDKNTGDVNWDDLKRAVTIAVRLQDDVIDYTPYFLDENEEQQQGERRVGIGSMGLGTLMIKLKLRYGSEKGNEFIDKLYKFIATEAYQASIDIAAEKGAFPQFDAEKMSQSGFMKRLLPELPEEYQDKFYKTGIRNVTLLTQAPCGSTGTYIDNIPGFRKEFGGTTTGIEPYFSWEYWRAGRLGVTKQTVDLAKDYLDAKGLSDINDLPDYFVTAMNLEPIDHVKVQAAVQKWTDSSISKTANCPSDYTLEQTEELYLESYKLGLKGMTIYRDGSRDSQVLATKEEDARIESHTEAKLLKELKQSEDVIVESKPVKLSIQKRPKRLYGFTDKVGFSYGDKFGKAYITVNLNDGEPWEVFISTKEKEVSSLAKALGLMTTKLLRLGGTSDNLQQAIDTLTYDQTMGTLPSGMANILKQIQKEKLEIDVTTGKKAFKLAKCESCGENSYDKGNCICHSCGISKCN